MGITIWQHLSDQTCAMAQNALKGLRSRAQWEKQRPRRHHEYMQSLGLAPLPERCDLQITEYGEFRGKGFRARRLGFQIMPDCWSSAAIYYPDPLPKGRLPGVLYVCGHAAIGTHHYQYHPIMWARRGYACLIVDTIEQNDNSGEHHGSFTGQLDRWLAMGYTPAGAEVWNAMRALDILAADPLVDSERLGTTGVSGGGACSLFLAVADARIKAVSTLCGASSPLDAVHNRHILNHCDCIYPHNIHQRDLSEFVALIAPRAALFCIARHDPLFNPEESQALVKRAGPVYKLYKQAARCAWTACDGPHGDHPEFDRATARWFDHHVSGRRHPPLPRGAREVAETVTNVFNGRPPAPDRLELLPQLLSPRGSLSLPATVGDWPQVRGQALKTLRREVPGLFIKGHAAASLKRQGDWRWSGARATAQVRIHRGQVDGMDIWLQMVAHQGAARKLVLGIAGANQFCAHAMSRVACHINPGSVLYGGFEPRLSGLQMPVQQPCAFPPGSRLAGADAYLCRVMALTGLTPAMMTFHDLGVLLDYLRRLPEPKSCEIYLHGIGHAAIAALYRGLVDERIAGVILEDIPSTHRHGLPLPGILRAFDIPQAVGLMAPRKVALVAAGHCNWTWPMRVFERLKCPGNFIRADELRNALQQILA
ncbi:MAG: alpha/beta hydrolase family protein [Kiritimatiellia bacterium]